MATNYSQLKRNPNSADPNDPFNKAFNQGGSYWSDPDTIGKTAQQVASDSQGNFSYGPGAGGNIYSGNNQFLTPDQWQNSSEYARRTNQASGASNPALTGLQTAAGANPATALSAQAAAAAPVAGPTQTPTPPQQPQAPIPSVTSATPVAPPGKPKRRMIKQSSHQLQGLRQANGAGY